MRICVLGRDKVSHEQQPTYSLRFLMKIFRTTWLVIALLIGLCASADAWIRGGNSFNGRLIQTNLTDPQGGGAFPFINALKGAQAPNVGDGSQTPIDPSIMDVNGYPTVLKNGGINTVFFIPTQTERPGYWVYDWQGNGTVTHGSMSQSAFTLNITGLISNSGGVQVYQLDGAASPYLIPGMLIKISGFTSAGSPNWTGANATIAIASVDALNNRITVNSGTTFGGAPANFTSTKITSVQTTTPTTGSPTGWGRYVLLPNGTGIGGTTGRGIRAQISITALNSSSDYPHDIRFYHIDDSAALALGQTYTAKFKQMVSNFGVLRTADWFGMNRNNMTTWSSRKPRGYICWACDHFVRDWDAGTTASATVDASGLTYTLNLPARHSANNSAWLSGGPLDKDTVHVTFRTGGYATVTSAAPDGAGNTTLTLAGTAGETTFANGNSVTIYGVGNGSGSGWTALNGTFTVSSVSGSTFKVPVNSSAFTGTPTFTLSGTGIPGTLGHTNIFVSMNGSPAIKMLDAYSNPIASRTDQFPIGSSSSTYGSRSLGTMTYDATLAGWIKTGGDAETNSDGIISGVPLEDFVDLAAQVGAHPYFTGAQFTNDPPTDFWPELMAYLSARQPSWMIPRYEIVPNETWNTANGFTQTTYANAKAAAYGWGAGDYNNWVGKAATLGGQMAAAVYGVRPGAATNYQVIVGVQTTTGADSTAASNARLESTKFISDNVTPSPLTWSGGTINFTVTPAAPAASNPNCGVLWACSTATNYVSHIADAQYFNDAVRNSTVGTNTDGATALAFNGGQFIASSIVNGTMTVTTNPNFTTKGATLAVGQAVFGANMPNGVTIVGDSTVNSGACSPACTGAGGVGTYALSDGTVNINYLQGYYNASDLSQAEVMANSVVNTVVNATITGSTFTVNSITSGTVISNVQRVIGGTIALSDNIKIGSGTYPSFTLFNSGGSPVSPGNQTAEFSLGATASLTNLAKIHLNWANWAVDHNVMKMTGYEGDFSPDYTGSSSGGASADLRNQLYARSRWGANMGTYYQQSFDNFLGTGLISYPPGFVAEFPSNFVPTGSYPSIGAWAQLEDIYISDLPTNLQPPGWLGTINYR